VYAIFLVVVNTDTELENFNITMLDFKENWLEKSITDIKAVKDDKCSSLPGYSPLIE